MVIHPPAGHHEEKIRKGMLLISRIEEQVAEVIPGAPETLNIVVGGFLVGIGIALGFALVQTVAKRGG